MIVNAIPSSTSTIFKISTTRTCFVLLSLIACSVPLLQALLFNLAINYDFMKTVFLSVFVAGIIYVFAYGFGLVLLNLVENIFKDNKEIILAVPLLLISSGFLITLVGELMLLNWQLYESVVNVHLAVMAVYYGLGNSFYKIAPLPFIKKNTDASKTDLESVAFVKPFLILLSVVIMLLAIGLYNSFSFKKYLYDESIELIRTSPLARELSVNEFHFSYFVKSVKGDNDSKFSFNVFGQSGIGIVTVTTTGVAEDMEITKVTLEFPHKSYSIDVAE